VFQMSRKRILADGDGMNVFGISRRDVADIHFGRLHFGCTSPGCLSPFTFSDAVAVVQMRFKRINADGDGMCIIGISRRNVADIHLGPLRHCSRYMEPRDSDTTMKEKKRFRV